MKNKAEKDVDKYNKINYSKSRKANKKKAVSVNDVKKIISRSLTKVGINDPQMKHHQVSTTEATLGYLPFGTYANLIGTTTVYPRFQGLNATTIESGTGTVVGNEITCKYMHIKALFYPKDTAEGHTTWGLPTTYGLVRMMVIEDLQPAAATTSALNDLWTYVGNNSYNRIIFTDQSIVSNLTTFDDRTFKVLYDRNIILNGKGQPGGVQTLDKWINLHGAKMTYVEAYTGSPNSELVPKNRAYYLLFIITGASSDFAYAMDARCDFGYLN